MSWKKSLLSIPKPWEIIFICSGNIMRSPFAEFLSKKYVEDYDPEIKKELVFKSGGVTYQNDSISEITKNLLIQEGIDKEEITKHKPRLLDNYPDYFSGNIFFIPMTNEHKKILKMKGKNYVFTLNQIIKSSNKDVLDPYFNPEMELEIFNDLKNSTKMLIEELNKLLNND
ncbi:MAG: arsenate reductase/protein-tyrosine-phosphatase family protein [Candidatus Hodarchaeales archaeon]|jgi:protein-tyrosine-phosphatase